MLEIFLNSQGIELTILRDNVKNSLIKGLFNTEKSTKRKYIGFEPGSDIKVNDIILNSANEKFYVTDTFTQYFNGEPYQLKAYYKTETEFKSSQLTGTNTIYNIENVSNSVFGNNNITTFNYQQLISDIKSQAATTEDNAEIQKIISLLEMIVDDKLPAKKGLLSSFSDIIAKHSWLSGRIADVLISWLTTLQI